MQFTKNFILLLAAIFGIIHATQACLVVDGLYNSSSKLLNYIDVFENGEKKCWSNTVSWPVRNMAQVLACTAGWTGMLRQDEDGNWSISLNRGGEDLAFTIDHNCHQEGGFLSNPNCSYIDLGKQVYFKRL